METLFPALQTRGFNLESTYVGQPDHLRQLVALLALDFGWAMLTGIWHHQHHPIPIKTHEHRAKSWFRYGCDFLRHTFCDLSLRHTEFNRLLQLLSPY